MDYRILAVDELLNIKKYRTAEKIAKIRICELESTLKSVGGGASGGTAKSGENKTEHRWLSLLASIDDERERLEGATRNIEKVEIALSAVSEDERKLLEMCYIQKKSVERFAEEASMSRATAYRLRDEALINFTRAMYGTVIT